MSNDNDNSDGEYRGATIRQNAASGGWFPNGPSRTEMGRGGWMQSLQLYSAFNYPRERDLNFNTWLSYYEREGQVAGILTKFVNDTWQGGAPRVIDGSPTEGDEADEDTEFESDVGALFDHNDRDLDLRQPFLNYLTALDVLGRLGEYAILVFGFKDDKDVDKPLEEESCDGLGDIAFVEIHPGSKVEYDPVDDLNDDRHGRPEVYKVGDKNQEVHHSRVIHNPGPNTLADPYHARPFFKNIANRIVDQQKILGASAEGYFRGGYPGIVIKPPQAITFNQSGVPTKTAGTFQGEGGDGGDALARQIEDYTQKYERTIRANGEVESLSPNVSSPTPHMDEQWGAIAAAKDVSQSVVKGNETGERATTEDNASLRSTIAGLRNRYAEPTIFRAAVDLCSYAGVIASPDDEKGRYDTEWDPLTELSDKEKVDIMNTKASAWGTGAQIYGQAPGSMAEFRKEVLNMDPEKGSEAPGTESEQDVQNVRETLDNMGFLNQGDAPGTESSMGSVDEPSGMGSPTQRITTTNARTNGGEPQDDGDE